MSVFFGMADNDRLARVANAILYRVRTRIFPVPRIPYLGHFLFRQKKFFKSSMNYFEEIICLKTREINKIPEKYHGKRKLSISIDHKVQKRIRPRQCLKI